MFAFNFNKIIMPIFYGKAALIDFLNSIKTPNSTIGFVPTMGALHQGHLSLMQQSLAENNNTVVSIFVNPTQFNNPEDLKKYPRTLEADTQKIAHLDANIIVYAPTVDDIYEGKTVSQDFDFDGLENQMEGKFRPGHFNGVGTIVKRLFEIVSPTNAYFGEKDFQQLQIVKKMVRKTHLDVNIIGCNIYREANGLAMSSRNERLSASEREKAAIIYQTLLEAKEKFETQNCDEVKKWVTEVFDSNSIFDLEYFEIADEETLLPCINQSKDKNYRAFIAVFVNNIRLIDTISLK
ncbi:pantoate--beta-alanine ligase [Flavobacterium sufflavum]|uniref:Pantothenate synthetase n=1 Tax=Flavobacterium sufflavum TaxID=1921138 RepID=A0A3S2WHI2_9FLAO|nr:pantoate--beta-alanine ligase [Flavobacterium sufflavum]RVT79791.1 pantoate--beta-alanine ligase [Flavobacterium sufflavum]